LAPERIHWHDSLCRSDISWRVKDWQLAWPNIVEAILPFVGLWFQSVVKEVCVEPTMYPVNSTQTLPSSIMSSSSRDSLSYQKKT